MLFRVEKVGLLTLLLSSHTVFDSVSSSVEAFLVPSSSSSSGSCFLGSVPPSPIYSTASTTTTTTTTTTTSSNSSEVPLEPSDKDETSSLASVNDETASSTATTTTTPSSNRLSLLRSILQSNAVLLGTTVLFAVATIVTDAWPLSEAGRQLRRNVLAGAAIFTLGDWGAQCLTLLRTSSRKDNAPLLLRFDQPRLAIAAALGVVWSGWAVPAVYAAAERLFPGRTVARIVAKMIVSCSFLSTAGNYITMFVRRYLKQIIVVVRSDTTTKRHPHDSRRRRIRSVFRECVTTCNRDIGEVIIDDLKVWPLYDILCYAWIPPALRPITTALMSSAWSMYMSLASAKESSSSTTSTNTSSPTEDDTWKDTTPDTQPLLATNTDHAVSDDTPASETTVSTTPVESS